MALCACRRLYPAERPSPTIEHGNRLLPSPLLCWLGARVYLLSGPQPVVHSSLRPVHSLVRLRGRCRWASPEGSPRRAPPKLRGFDLLPRQDFHLLIHGYLQATHNDSERALRQLVIGRRNWLFVGSDDGGHRAATFVSLIASAKLHGIEPYAYLRDLFCLLPGWARNKVIELAPAYFKQTLKREDVQQRLNDNPFRRVTLGLPTESPLYVARS